MYTARVCEPLQCVYLHARTRSFGKERIIGLGTTGHDNYLHKTVVYTSVMLTVTATTVFR